MPSTVILSPDAVPSLDLLEREVMDGLPHAGDRMDDALTYDHYFKGESEQYIERRPHEDDVDFRARPKRVSLLTGQVTRLLASQLWARPPQRSVEANPALTDWYRRALAAAQADVRLLAADRAATLGHASAVEVEATGDPSRPFKLYVWKPHEYTVWCHDDDPADPWAICTRSRVQDRQTPGKMRLRYRLWSALERRTYYSKPFGPGESVSGRRADFYEPSESGLSPYPGVLPFTFVRFEPAVSEFWSGGLGKPLCDANHTINVALSDIAEHVARFLNPIGIARNMPASADLTHRVGQFLMLPSLPTARQGDTNAQPELAYLQAQLGVEMAWLDLQNYTERKLEELNIPASLVRTSYSATDASGVAIAMKQVPFHDQAKARHPFASETETELFARCCAVVGSWHQTPALLDAAHDPRLVTVWPEPRIPLPAPERNTADAWELEHGIADPIEVLARRRGITIDQAEDLARAIATRKATWTAIMGAPTPPTASPPDPTLSPEDAAEAPDGSPLEDSNP